MNDFLIKLHKHRALQIDNIEFLHSPDDFYNKIVSELQRSEEAYICTLYIGAGQKCEKLLKIIQDRKLNNKKTRVVVDKNRAIRTENFIELIKHYEIEDQFVLCENGSLSIFPKKLKELFGVLHSKIYIFDDVVLISGANLEDAYFCDRIDRYLVIKDEALALELYNEHFLLHDPESETKIASSKPQEKCNGNTYIIPYNRENEIEMLESIFEYEYDSKYISTAYLNLTQEHIRVFKDKNIDMIIARAVESMFKYFRLSNMVADNYLINAKKAVTALTDLKIHEYCQPGTTYHCKGLWCFRDDFVVTVTGSSNYNYRSLYRDIETNFLIITNDPKIIDGLSSELKIILEHAVDSDTKDILDREVGTLSKLSNLFLRYYL